MASHSARPSRRAFNGLAAAGLASAILGRVATSAAAQAPFDAAALARDIEALRREHNVAGAAVAIVRDGRIAMLQGLGLRDVERNLPVTPDTSFAIASTTKAFTSMAAAISVDEGRLRLDDHPRRFLPEFKLADPTADQQITIADLMSHTSGVDRNDLSWMMGQISRPEVLSLLPATQPSAPLRTRMLYNNVMFMTVSEVIARANGMSFEAYLEQRLLRPLGMTGTRQTVATLAAPGDRAHGYAFSRAAAGFRPITPNAGMDIVAGAGSLVSSARDMANWLTLLADGGVFQGRRLVSEAGFAQLLTPRIAMQGGGSYGLGWEVYDNGLATHGGNQWGFTCQVGFLRAARLGVAVLSNDNASGFPESALEAILSRMQPLSSERSASLSAAIHAANRARQGHAPQADADARLNELVGLYRDWLDEIEIRLTDGRAVLLRGSQPPGAIASTPRPDHFTVSGTPPQTLTAQRGSDGGIDKVAINEGGAERAFERIADDRPRLDDVMAKVLGALGGEMVMRGRRSITLRGVIRMPIQGLLGRIERIWQAPYLRVETMTFAVAGRPIGTWRNYFDGERTGVEYGGSHLAQDPAFARALRTMHRFDPLTTWRESFAASSVVGKARIDNDDVVVVAHRNPGGDLERHYYAADTYLPRRVEQMAGEGANARVVTMTALADYRQVSGLLVPFRETSSGAGNGRTETVFEEAIFDVAYDAATFGPRQP